MIIGAREIAKNIKESKIKKVLVASNCPEFLIKKIKQAVKTEIEKFDGDEKKLGTKIGKPFPVAMVGYTQNNSEKK